MTLLSKTEQTVGEARLTVGVNDDDLQAGYNDVGATINAAGGFISFPAGPSLGSLKLFASSIGAEGIAPNILGIFLTTKSLRANP